MTSKCWFPTSAHVLNKTKQCMGAYALSEGSTIGYSEYYDSAMKHQNYLNNGKVC